MTWYTYGDALIAQSTHPHPSQEGIVRFYQYDGLGSTRSLTDATGAVTDAYTYDAYGLLLEQTGASANPYLYRGEQFDPDTDAYYLRARYYQTGIGRFLTTDPMEGFPNAPLSLHRYAYGNDAPVNFLDPSGKFTLKDTMQAVAIINIISVTAIALGGWEDTYAALGEGIFPDAFALGVTGSIGGNLPFILSGGGLFGSLITGPHLTYGRGIEVLMSVSSGEIGVFWTESWPNLTFGVAEPLQARADLYKGFVWNLWNVKNYEGPFYSVSVLDWVTIFCDAKAGFTGGAWGAGRTLRSWYPKVLPEGWDKRALTLSRINYKTLQGSIIPLHPAIVTTGIIVATTAANAIADKVENNQLGVLMLEISMWGHTAIAKHYWGKQMPDYSYERRRKDSRPSNFESGPRLLRYFIQ